MAYLTAPARHVPGRQRRARLCGRRRQVEFAIASRNRSSYWSFTRRTCSSCWSSRLTLNRWIARRQAAFSVAASTSPIPLASEPHLPTSVVHLLGHPRGASTRFQHRRFYGSRGGGFGRPSLDPADSNRGGVDTAPYTIATSLGVIRSARPEPGDLWLSAQGFSGWHHVKLHLHVIPPFFRRMRTAASPEDKEG
jgi:hypothetical protein